MNRVKYCHRFLNTNMLMLFIVLRLNHSIFTIHHVTYIEHNVLVLQIVTKELTAKLQATVCMMAFEEQLIKLLRSWSNC